MIELYKKIQILRTSWSAKFFLILFVGLSICIISCDEASVVGLNVQPQNDLLHVGYIDTTTLITKTVRVDSVYTDGISVSQPNGLMIFGKYNDPVFGPTSSSIYTQVRLPSNIESNSFGTNPVCDSIILALAYDGSCYGKTIRKAQTVNVYQVIEDMPVQYYFSNNSFNTSTFDLANSYSFIPRPADTLTIMGIKTIPELRVPLDNNFGQVLLNNQGSGNLASNTAFQNFMKGLYITTEHTNGLGNDDGNIMHIKMTQSAITLYYHYTGKTLITNVDSVIPAKYDFDLGSVIRFMHFKHDYSNGIVDPNLASQLSASPPVQNNTVFIQPMAGLRTKVEMPTLMNWVKSGPIAINKAELIIKTDPTTTYEMETFSPPASITAAGINDDGTIYLLPDVAVESNRPGYYGGKYDAVTHEYHINVSLYIQQVLNGTRKNNGVYILTGVLSSLNPDRVVIGGGGSGSSYQMKLNITYTKLH
jgi:hypothetical protein